MRSKGRCVVASIFVGLLVSFQTSIAAGQVEVLGTDPTNGKTMIAGASKNPRDFSILVPPRREPNNYHTVIIFVDKLDINASGEATFETTHQADSSWQPNSRFLCQQFARKLDAPSGWQHQWLGFNQITGTKCVTGERVNTNNLDDLDPALNLLSTHNGSMRAGQVAADSRIFFTKDRNNRDFIIHINHRIADEDDIRMGYKYIYRFRISVPRLTGISGASQFAKINGNTISIDFPPLDTNTYEVLINGTTKCETQIADNSNSFPVAACSAPITENTTPATPPNCKPDDIKCLEGNNKSTDVDIKTADNVELVDKSGKPIGEIDRVDMVNRRLIEAKDGTGLGTPNPTTGRVNQAADQWAEKEIYTKTVAKIKALENATATRATVGGSTNVPSLEEIQKLRSLDFYVKSYTDEVQEAVNLQVDRLRVEYPRWGFSAYFGKGL